MTLPASSDPTPEATDTETTPSSTDPDMVFENVVVEGTIVTSASEYATDSVAQTVRARSITTTPSGQRPTLVQLVLGSVLVLSDEMGERIVVDESQMPPTTRTPESVFRPVSEFEQLMGGAQYRRTRYLTLGVASDARRAAARGIDIVDDVTDAAGRTMWRVAGPVWNSTLLRPVRRPVQRWRKRGEDQVRQWIESGMHQEMRSRAVASASLNNLVQESVTDLTNNPDVQVLVQEVIQSQSVGLVGEIVGEIRERLISMDIWLQGVFGKALPNEVPFRETYLRSLRQLRPQYEHVPLHNTMAGYPAGFVSRFVAFMIDVALLLLVYAIASASLSGTLALFGLTDLVSQFLSSGAVVSQVTLAIIGMASFLLVTGYGVLSWYLTGATVGDTIMGLQVVDRAGGRLSFSRSVRRMVGVYVAAIPLFIGFFWVLLNGNRQGWHDKIGGTYVLYDWPAKPDEAFLNAHVANEIAEDGRKRAPVK